MRRKTTTSLTHHEEIRRTTDPSECLRASAGVTTGMQQRDDIRDEMYFVSQAGNGVQPGAGVDTNRYRFKLQPGVEPAVSVFSGHTDVVTQCHVTYSYVLTSSLDGKVQ